jgi:uncharacterized protein (TIGR00106 family)
LVVSFSIIPVGTGEELKEHIAEILDIVDKSGIPYTLGAMQTTLEGNENEVMALIMKCHNRMKELSPRVLTSITIDDRANAEGRLKGKIEDVEKVLNRGLSHE